MLSTSASNISYKNSPCHYGLLCVLTIPNTYVMQVIIDTDGLLSTRAWSHNSGWKEWHKHTTYTTKDHE